MRQGSNSSDNIQYFFLKVTLGVNMKRYFLKHHKPALSIFLSDGHFLNGWTLFT